jgi:F420H(2)-dependent quinone reductase
MTAAISRRIPPQRLINLGNPAVRGMLRSPFHAALDRSLLVLHIVGRKTGRRYDIPVGYVDLDGHLVIVTQHSWRANLRGGADIDVTYHGRRERMHAELHEDPSAVATMIHEVMQRLGLKAAQRLTGFTTPDGLTTSVEQLEVATREYNLASLTLTPVRNPALGAAG